MSENTVKARLKHAVKPESTWTSENPVLKEGEVGYVKETGRYKVGDGKTAWNSLAWGQPSSHTHDDRYYTETEIDTKLKTKSDTGHTHNYAGSSTPSGVANSAAKLATARTINGTSFDGSGNITTANWGTSRNITIGNAKKAVNGGGDISWSLAEIGASATNHTHSTMNKEAYLEWGGKNFAGSYGPIDAAMIPDLGANRLAFLNKNGVKVEYSNDSGKTWKILTDYGTESGLFGVGKYLTIGNVDTPNKATEKDMLRVTIDSDKARIYSVLNKFAIYINTNGATGSYCTIDASLESSPTTFKTFADKVHLSGWSGWNIINIQNLTTYQNSASGQYGLIRFTFGCTGNTSNYVGLQINRIMGFGGVGWDTPSNMAKYGTIYSYDNDQNVEFPAQVSATLFKGNASTSSAVKDSNDRGSITFAYSKAGMNYSDYTWLAAWNGKELRAISKSQFAQASHTHTKSQITDFPTSLKNPTSLILRLNGGTTEGTNQFTYDGSTAKTISITPSGIGAATSGHNHDSAYLGKTATASAATKLATKREVFAHYDSDFVMNFSYDGSANSITTLLGYYSAGSNVQGANNYPYHRFAKLDKITSNYADRTSTFLITQDYDGGGWGIVRLSLRTDGAGTDSTVSVQWLCRVKLPADFIQVGIYNVSGSTYADAFIRHTGTYSSTIIRNLASGSRGNILRTWILVTSVEDGHSTATDKKNSAEAYATIAAAGTELHKQAYSKIVSGEDAGTVSYAHASSSSTKATQDSVGQQINTTYIKSLSISGKTITYTKGDNTTGTITTQDTDSHYTTGLKVCASATGTAHAAATNGKMRINVLDNTTVRDSIIIQGTGATSVTSDASGVITINSASYSTGTTSTAGLTKLYTSTGTSTDGTMTRKAITEALSGKAASNHNHDGDYVPLENGTVTVSSDMGAYIDLQDTNGGLGTHLQMSVKGASKWDLAAKSNGELSLTYITSAGSNWLYAMNASGINMYQSVTVRPSPLATTANSMMIKVSTAGLQNFTGRTISLYASGSDNNYAGIYDHDNGWILYCDTDKVVHIPKELSTTSVTVSRNLQWRNSSGTAYVIAGTLSNDSYKNMTRIGNLTYETGIYTKTNVWKNGSTTTHFATTTTTSDQRLKEKISDMSVYEDFFCKLKPFAFKYHEGLYNANGTKPMIQWGYGAQDTVKAFKESGLDWQQEELVVIEDGELTEEEKKYTTDGKMFKMNYQNMSALNTHMIQKCLEEIAELKRQLVELKEG
nr:MAG TPA: hyaluronidase [Caudoviricetes sp.]